jgi:hypothetical protein
MVRDVRREDPTDHGVIAQSVPSARHRQRVVEALGQEAEIDDGAQRVTGRSGRLPSRRRRRTRWARDTQPT